MHPVYKAFSVDTVERIKREIFALPIAQLKHKQDLMTRYSWMNSPSDNLELIFINERLKP